MNKSTVYKTSVSLSRACYCGCACGVLRVSWTNSGNIASRTIFAKDRSDLLSQHLITRRIASGYKIVNPVHISTTQSGLHLVYKWTAQIRNMRCRATTINRMMKTSFISNLNNRPTWQNSQLRNLQVSTKSMERIVDSISAIQDNNCPTTKCTAHPASNSMSSVINPPTTTGNMTSELRRKSMTPGGGLLLTHERSNWKPLRLLASLPEFTKSKIPVCVECQMSPQILRTVAESIACIV